jgi:hypothetical protein
MVAFELAKFFETSGLNADAARWYLAAAERFRRADWKLKAQEAAVRLGGELPVGSPSSEISAEETESPGRSADRFLLTPPPSISAEPGLPFEQNPAALESVVDFSSQVQAAAEPAEESAGTEAEKKHRRRGRRGGRNRRKPGAEKDARSDAPARLSHTAVKNTAAVASPSEEEDGPVPPRVTHTRAMPQLPVESFADPGAPSVKGRYGDPGLSSRISLLEMQFRRLLTCPPAKLGEADHAPVGPGVFVLTDSDLTSYYYVEACQTLRIAVGNLLRGGTSRRGADSIKPQLADHLGIPEARVPKYLADHCVVRWLQLDEGASHFAHFVIAVLRPILNE